MGYPSFRAVTALTIFILTSSHPAGAVDRRPFDCKDAFRPEAVVRENEAFRTALTTSPSENAARSEASKAIEAALRESLSGVPLEAEMQALVADIGVVIDNPIFDEALARALTLSGVKKIDAIETFKKELRMASEKDQLEFSNLVIRQYEGLLDEAFTWVDEDRFRMLEKRWGLDEKSAFKLMKRWTTLSTTHSGEVALGALAWAKAIDGKRILDEIKTLRKANEKLLLNDAEEIVITRIRTPHTDLDLAMNKGPISDKEFTRKMRFWNTWGWLKHKLNILRYPNESSFVIILSIVPVSIVHGLVKDWNLTNTVATIIGGVATCPPLIAKLTRAAVRQNHDAVWLEVYTLKQLSEFKRFIQAKPTRALELGFQGLDESLELRMEVLRKLRAEKLGE